MSKRAEEEAWKAYPKRPEQRYITAHGTFEFDYDAPNREGFIKGYELAEKDLGWHLSTEHPPVDEEVIVLLGRYEDFPQIAFGHIVDQNIAIDYNGWNIPGVMYWMPMPKIPKEEEK